MHLIVSYSYTHTGWGAEQGEREKRASWEDKGAIERRRAMSANDVEFVPFSIEAGGAWGPAARKFFDDCLKLADSDRDADLYQNNVYLLRIILMKNGYYDPSLGLRS